MEAQLVKVTELVSDGASVYTQLSLIPEPRVSRGPAP